MKRFVFAVVVLFAVALAFPSTGFGCGVKGDHAKGEGEHAHKDACPMKDKKVAEKTEVAMTGQLLCMHCNLHKEEKCRKVFQSADNQEKLYNLCPGTKVDLDTHLTVLEALGFSYSARTSADFQSTAPGGTSRRGSPGPPRRSPR